MSELEEHRDTLRTELERLRAEIASQERVVGGDEARRLRHTLTSLKAEIARLTEDTEGLTDELVQLEDELEELRRETAGARKHLADLVAAKA
jgi:chromosome segregation ATPase